MALLSSTEFARLSRRPWLFPKLDIDDSKVVIDILACLIVPLIFIIPLWIFIAIKKIILVIILGQIERRSQEGQEFTKLRETYIRYNDDLDSKYRYAPNPFVPRMIFISKNEKRELQRMEHQLYYLWHDALTKSGLEPLLHEKKQHIIKQINA